MRRSANPNRCKLLSCVFILLISLISAGMMKPGQISGQVIRPEKTDRLTYVNDTLERSFISPPAAYRPGVFWQWMGGLLSKEGITKDLEAMSSQGIGSVLVMQMPDQFVIMKRWKYRDYPGKIRVFSDEWFDIVNYAIGEADRLGMTFSILMSPGWSHAGSPLVTPRRSLKKLVSADEEVKGPMQFNKRLPRAPRPVGRLHYSPSWAHDSAAGPPSAAIAAKAQDVYYKVAVLAVPKTDKKGAVSLNKIIDLTDKTDADGVLKWEVPDGSWVISRIDLASVNATNHPAPAEGTGLEADRMDPEAVRVVFDGAIARILHEAEEKGYHSFRAFHTDSYEADFQDFGLDFRTQFRARRGYDCIPWLPAWLNKNLVIENKGFTQRFRDDMTRTISALMEERFYGKLRGLADEYGVEWSLEPYFTLPIDWRGAASKSRLSGSEFWIGKPYNLIGPAPDVAALYGLSEVWAESFTAESYNSAWRNTPWILKPWGDEAFCRGINQLYMHGFPHNPFSDRYKPGLTMSYWGTQFSRNLTWWPYSYSWHQYLSRCQFMLQQGSAVNDVLVYPSKTQQVATDLVNAGPFRQVVLNDEALMNRIWVRDDGRIAVKGGGSFSAIALTPRMALRPESLRRIRDLVKAGATLIGEAPPPVSASLERFPDSDKEISMLIEELWGTRDDSRGRPFAKGRVLATTDFITALNKVTGGPDVRFLESSDTEKIRLAGSKAKEYGLFYPGILAAPPAQINANSSDKLNPLDYVHRRDGNTDIYFESNTSDRMLHAVVDFRVDGRIPELWDPVRGKIEKMSEWKQENGRTAIPMQFYPRQSFFVVFKGANKKRSGALKAKAPRTQKVKEFSGSWNVSFDTAWGGPAHIEFNPLEDWSKRTEKNIRYYSGRAIYQKQFDLTKMLPTESSTRLYLDLGKVHDLAKVSLNGRDLGTVWCAPWEVEIPLGLLRRKGNELKIEVVNTWVNRLIGDEQEPDDMEFVKLETATNRKGSYDIEVAGYALKDLPDWLIRGEPRSSPGRYTFTTWRFYDKNAPLLPAGLLGPVKIVSVGK